MSVTRTGRPLSSCRRLRSGLALWASNLKKLGSNHRRYNCLRLRELFKPVQSGAAAYPNRVGSDADGLNLSRLKGEFGGLEAIAFDAPEGRHRGEVGWGDDADAERASRSDASFFNAGETSGKGAGENGCAIDGKARDPVVL